MGLQVHSIQEFFVRQLNIMEIQEWTKNSLYKTVQTHIFEMWRFWMLKNSHWKVIKYNGIFPTFIRTLLEMSAAQNWIWP